MIDPTKLEMDAVKYGGVMGGEYLDSIGKTDLATLSADEWESFLLCVVGGYHDEIVKLQYEAQ